jgi:di/tricarboxylate transporter
VVASLMSVVKQNKFHAPSKLLLPLSYAAIFGGTITLVGTSTNLIVNGFVIERGLPPLEMFDFIYVGIPVALIGSFVLVFITRFLPEQKNEISFETYFIEAKQKKTLLL